MKKLTLITISLLFSLSAFSSERCEHTFDTFRCVDYISNYDGDTITVTIPGQHPLFGEEISVRLNGIDTPEKRTKDKCEKKLAVLARDYLKYRILKSQSGTVELRDIQRGKYFRVVAEVWVNGRNLNQDMIRKGLAVEYFGDTKQEVNWCKFRPEIPNDMYDELAKYESQH